ncbi:MAG: signal peptidase I [Candidatus Nomurabacteria bacterium]|jgi:signal peptidase I|nr:signal peptidase I [Candidatus Nomurabacteria bacterium]
MLQLLKRNEFKLALAIGGLLVAAGLGSLVARAVNFDSWWYVLLWAAFALLAVLLVGWQKGKSFYDAMAWQIVAIYLLLFFLIIYILGIVVGFQRSGYAITPKGLWHNVAPPLVATILMELARYTAVKHSGGKKWLLILVGAAWAAVAILAGLSAYHLVDGLDIFEMVALLALPAAFNSALLTFINYKASWRPALVFALPLAIWQYVLPIVPNLGPYLLGVAEILLPTLLLIRVNEFFITRRAIPGRSKHRLARFLTLAPTVAVLLVIAGLISGVFRYKALAIGSGSMTGTINKGDAVIIDQSTKSLDKIKVGTVVAYRHSGEIIVHRLIKLFPRGDSVIGQTKGDFNNAQDGWTIDSSEVLGTVNWRLPLVGWPTVWLNQTLTGKSAA